MNVRTRVAPSPTGDPHIGTAYVALMNYCFARKRGGEFILRIEDTDRARSSDGSERAILACLHWLGLAWDEGPDIGGPRGPYRQSERSEIYRAHAEQLLDEKRAFMCFCSADTLARMRAAQASRGERPRYDGRCLALSAPEVRARESAGAPYAVRLRPPTSGVCTIADMLRGAIDIAWNGVDMQVLIKSDGTPTYHLANVIDDHLMGVTHVLRGEEWITSTPKHLALYRYFGWDVPAFGHLPLLRNPDRSKLSKRRNATGVLFYQQMGYLPEVLVNFLGLHAMSAAGGEELMALADLVEQFDVRNISLGGPVFDVSKLDWLNRRYLRERLTPAQLLQRYVEWACASDRLLTLAELAQPRIGRLSDVVPLAGFLFSGMLDVPAEKLRDNTLAEHELQRAYQLAIEQFDKMPDWRRSALEAALRDVAAGLDRPCAKWCARFTSPSPAARSHCRCSTPWSCSAAMFAAPVYATHCTRCSRRSPRRSRASRRCRIDPQRGR